MKFAAFCLVVAIVAPVSLASAIGSDPFADFNVYSLGSIGSSGSPYQSDIQGVVGAALDTYFSSFSLGGGSGVGLYVGRNATLTGGYNRGIQANGNVYLGNASVAGNVVSGGNISNFAGGSMTGNAISAGTVNLSQQFTVAGTKQSGAVYQSAVDFSSVNAYFKSTSTTVGALAATGSLSDYYGNLSLTVHSGLNVVTVSAATLRNAWGVTLTGPANAVIVINVPDANVTLDSTNWSVSGGLTAGDVLLNMPNATMLNLSGGNNVNILAPFANTTFSSGVLNGGLYVGNLSGGGQINLGDFYGAGQLPPTPVPEPASLVFLAVGGLALLRWNGRRARSERRDDEERGD